jgi:hypothetical protein
VITDEQIYFSIDANVQDFHTELAYFLESVSLRELLRGENPYVLMRRSDGTVDVLIRSLLDKHLERWKTRLFGDTLEKLAIHISETVYGGRKSEFRGIDIEFAKGGDRYVVILIPFPCYDEGNEILEMEDNFQDAARSIKIADPSAQIVPVIGCFYGREAVTDREEYFKYCGQEFWELISGDPDLYTRIVEPLRLMSARRSERFTEDYTDAVNRLSARFYRHFCDERGAISWEKLDVFISAKGPEPTLGG